MSCGGCDARGLILKDAGAAVARGDLAEAGNKIIEVTQSAAKDIGAAVKTAQARLRATRLRSRG